MNALACPRCAQVDQVQSAATVYSAGHGIQQGTATGAAVGFAWGQFGVAPVVVGHRSHFYGVQASQLALLVAPPELPRRPPRVPSIWELLLILLVGVPGLLVAGYAVSAPEAPSFWARVEGVTFGLVMLALPLTVLWLCQRWRRRRWAAYRAIQRIWPEVGRALWEAMVCLRCHIAFYPPGVLQGVAAARQLIPLPLFREAVLRIAAEATYLAELAAAETGGARPIQAEQAEQAD